ncbi:MAG TPA: PHB depolymerase family esterase [Opitutaceae bacterium]|jgi:polyhydroxybutyrate depolymerase|nr:PHB depolymerase family esterase [Opitutaceae bacterium]
MAPTHPIRRVAGVVILAIAGVFLAPASSGGPLDRTVVVGSARHYLLVLPEGRDPKVALPLVFVFHGSGNTGAIMQEQIGMTEVARAKDFIAAFPDGLGKHWNGGISDPDSLAAARSDDVAFVSAMIDQIGTEQRVDPRRVYATGSSNGAIFCYTLACRLSDRIAAIAPVSGLLGESLSGRYHPKHPVSLISFNGTDDPLLHFAGEPYDGRSLMSVNDSVAYWVRRDQCDPTPSVTQDPPSPLDDGVTIIRIAYHGGTDGTAVEAFVIAHGGHTWPGHRTDPGWAKTAGKTAMSISANELMLDFFLHHPKP